MVLAGRCGARRWAEPTVASGRGEWGNREPQTCGTDGAASGGRGDEQHARSDPGGGGRAADGFGLCRHRRHAQLYGHDHRSGQRGHTALDVSRRDSATRTGNVDRASLAGGDARRLDRTGERGGASVLPPAHGSRRRRGRVLSRSCARATMCRPATTAPRKSSGSAVAG